MQMYLLLHSTLKPGITQPSVGISCLAKNCISIIPCQFHDKIPNFLKLSRLPDDLLTIVNRLIFSIYLIHILTGSAITQNSASVHVQAHVAANISVTPTTSELYSVFIDHDHADRIEGRLSFTVRANQSKICLQVKATDLHHQLPGHHARMPLTDEGATLERLSALDTTAPDTILAWSETSTLNGRTAKATHLGIFESALPSNFHEEVSVHVSWDPSNQSLPPGTYEGHVKLIGFILPQ